MIKGVNMKKLLVCLVLSIFFLSSFSAVEAATKSPWRPAKKTVKKKVVKKKVVKTKKAAKKPVKKTVVKSTVVVEEKPVIPPSTVKPAVQPAKPAAPVSRMAVSPKIGLGTGGLNSFGLGCEFSFPIMPQTDLMLEAGFWPVSGAPIIMIGGNGIYHFEHIKDMPVDFYSGAGAFYQMINVTGAGNMSAIGFQVLGGADIPVSGLGMAFAQMKYGIASYSYAIGPISVSASSGGFVLEGGYRFYL